MKVEREQLERQLRLAIEEYAGDTKVHNEVVKNLINKNIPPGETRGILTKSNLHPLEVMDINLLYTLTKNLYRATGEVMLDPTRYFYDAEIEVADRWSRSEEEHNITELVIQPIIQVASDQWIGTLSAQKLARLYNNGRILYRPETQRGMRITKDRDTIINRIDYNIDAINNIQSMLLNGQFIPNTITLNVLKDGNDIIQYDPNKFKLIIGAESEIDVADGFHRSYGLLKSLIVNPNLDFTWEVRITNWDVNKAQRFIYQEDYKTPLRKEYKELLNQAKLQNVITKNLNEQPQNEMQFKIATDNNAIVHYNAYTMFNTVAESIGKSFEVKSQRDVRKITDYLIEFFNELIGMYIDDFTNLEESQKTSYITVPNMFIGYIALAGELYNRGDWVTMLEKVMNSIDFTENNGIWRKMNIKWSNLSKRAQKQLVDYFKQKIKEVNNHDR